MLLPGRVIRSTPSDDGPGVRVAVEFGDLTEGQRIGIESLIARLMEAHAPGPFESLRPDASPSEIRKAIEAVPLPHRIALAARASTREREILRHDTAAAVLEALARNPNLILAEARALVQSVHILPTTLEAIAGDSRWAKDEDLHVAIAAHPKVPLHVGERIVSGLNPAALRRLMTRPGLHGVLREKIVRNLARG